MKTANYNCPNCNGRLPAYGPHKFIYEDCGERVIESVERIAEGDFEASEYAKELLEGSA